MGGENKGRRLMIGLAGLVVAAAFTSTAPFALKAAADAVPGNVTFTKDIAPILQRSCQNCHRPDGVAPMSLITYEDVRPWARAIKQRTGIGPRAAVKALNKSISEIAQAIDKGDQVYLKTLPGIGNQKAKEIIAKLQLKSFSVPQTQHSP